MPSIELEPEQPLELRPAASLEPQKPAPQPRPCPKCGQNIPVGSMFCPSCGGVGSAKIIPDRADAPIALDEPAKPTAPADAEPEIAVPEHKAPGGTHRKVIYIAAGTLFLGVIALAALYLLRAKPSAPPAPPPPTVATNVPEVAPPEVAESSPLPTLPVRHWDGWTDAAAKNRDELLALKQALDEFRAKNNRYPAKLEELNEPEFAPLGASWAGADAASTKTLTAARAASAG